MTDNSDSNNSLKQKEIQRLIDSSGKKEPVKGILSDDEILKYAGDSKAAASIRLKNGSDDISDKWRIHKRKIIILFVILIIPLILLYILSFRGYIPTVIMFLIVLLVLIDYPLYFLYIKDYTKSFDSQNQKEKPPTNDNEIDSSVNNLDSFNVYKSQIEDLKSLYDVKEKIAKELIEKRFEPPQLTYDKFITSVNNCTELFNNQAEITLNMINLATEHTPEMDYEIESRINILKSIIEKIDSLTNALVINIGQSQSEEDKEINNLLEDMENLIDSIKEYN